MSWSFQAVGKPAAVAKAARSYKETAKCAEPEEAVRLATLELIAEAVMVQGDAVLVRASGSGSMWKNGDVIMQSNVEMKVEPLYGLVE